MKYRMRLYYAEKSKGRSPEVCSIHKSGRHPGYAFVKHGRRCFVFSNGCIKSQARLLAAILVGRPLGADEAVHHVNGIRTDDRLANFQVVPTVAHQRFHAFVDNGKPAPPELASKFRFVREAA